MPHNLLFTRQASLPLRWNAGSRLIWHPKDIKTHYSTPDQAFCYFRKELVLERAPSRATARIFADSRYRLWINGEELARGPARSDPRWPLVDEVAISENLHSGKNIVVILVAYFGYRTGQTITRYPALIFEVDLDLESGRRTVGTDESWKCLPAPEFILGASRINGCQPRMEVIDVGQRDERLHRAGYDDGSWISAQTRDPDRSPFWHWTLRDIPLLERGYFPFLESCSHGDFTCGPAGLHPLPEQIIQEQKSITWHEEVRKLPLLFEPGDAGAGRVAILDGGTMEVGYFEAIVETTDACVIDLLFGEYLHEKNVPIDLGANRALERHLVPPGRHRIESMFNWRAARFVQVFIRSRGSVTLHEAGFQTRHYPLADRAAARTGDALLDSLWAASLKTLRLCLQDGMLDSSSREQQQWMGDGRLQALYHYYISGDARLHRRLLESFAQSQDCTGMTTSRYPDDHHNLPPIPSFCLHWISSFAEYERLTGDHESIRKWWPNLLLGIRWFTAYEGNSGLLENVPGWAFIDWGSQETPREGMGTALNLLYLEALKNMADLSRLVEDAGAERYFFGRVTQMSSALREVAWDEGRGAYVDYVAAGKRSAIFSETVNALALLHLHEAPEDPRAESIFKAVFPSEGISDAVPCSPFFIYFVTKAMARHGRHAQALRCFRARYAPMLRWGDTVWERWFLTQEKPLALSSASHAWASAWLAHAIESVVGVESLAPHFRRIRLRPHLGDLEGITCGIPTGGDSYQIEIIRGEGDLQFHFVIPQGCEIVLGERSFFAGEHRDIRARL
jgi:alpha-L-rhamnosidase